MRIRSKSPIAADERFRRSQVTIKGFSTSLGRLSIVRLLENSSSMGFYYRKSVDLGLFRGEVLGNYEAEKDK